MVSVANEIVFNLINEMSINYKTNFLMYKYEINRYNPVLIDSPAIVHCFDFVSGQTP